MELKTLIYIVIGFIWLLSKISGSIRKSAPGTPPVQRPLPEPVSGELKAYPARNQPMVKSKMKRQDMFEKPAGSLENTESIEKVVNYEGRLFRNEQKSDEAPVLQEVQRLEDTGEMQNAMAMKISEEIKSGTFDWKRAVVINELLKHQHFR